MSHHVVVIGAGIVGAATAVELLRDGHAVTIVEPGDPGGEQAASYGNGTLLNPSSVIPMSSPGLWKKVPGYLADPLGPLAIRWRYLPRLWPWLYRFVRAGSTVAKVEATARALAPLIADAPERHRKLAEEAGVAELIRRHGVLFVFPSRADFVAEATSWRIRHDNGTRWIELTEDELRQREPALARRYTFAVLVEANAQCIDPGALVGALVRHAQALGAVLRRARVIGLRIAAGRLRAVGTDGGDIACDHALIADPGIELRLPMMPSDGKMAHVMTPQGLRIAGQVELAGLDAAPNWKRAEILRDFALSTWPGLPRDLPAERVKVWMGHRPSLPDGLPCIGPASGCPDVMYAFGHGHIGLTAGPATGALVADLIAGRAPKVDPSPYAARRFR